MVPISMYSILRVSEPARALSINDRGHLIVEKNGKTETVFAGEISIRLDEQTDLPK